ncbi:hypothetical protein [Myxococcus virescens]|uniref:Uncharacterized protein n=1 Tax=Myxococcus virescens TaxID=83456 RepID=A0A511HCR4_9BACT|nr:hypothetical protein [Myxococcus virescens]GEL71337.1 hypothetical protein MVI01_31210 [Myxococcus virescens]SDE09271.1 hypothetical protein SAMN04488504_104165 [Myxococcus virescens]
MARLADLARTPFRKPEDARLLEQGLGALRDSGAQDLALLRHIEGRFYLEQVAHRGQALADASRLPAAGVSAHKARVYSYTSLILDAGRTGEGAGALRRGARHARAGAVRVGRRGG